MIRCRFIRSTYSSTGNSRITTDQHEAPSKHLRQVRPSNHVGQPGRHDPRTEEVARNHQGILSIPPPSPGLAAAAVDGMGGGAIAVEEGKGATRHLPGRGHPSLATCHRASDRSAGCLDLEPGPAEFGNKLVWLVSLTKSGEKNPNSIYLAQSSS